MRECVDQVINLRITYIYGAAKKTNHETIITFAIDYFNFILVILIFIIATEKKS